MAIKDLESTSFPLRYEKYHRQMSLLEYTNCPLFTANAGAVATQLHVTNLTTQRGAVNIITSMVISSFLLTAPI